MHIIRAYFNFSHVFYTFINSCMNRKDDVLERDGSNLVCVVIKVHKFSNIM